MHMDFVKVTDYHARGQLGSLTAPELKSFLGARKAKVGGKKEDLIQRIVSLLDMRWVCSSIVFEVYCCDKNQTEMKCWAAIFTNLSKTGEVQKPTYIKGHLNLSLPQLNNKISHFQVHLSNCDSVLVYSSCKLLSSLALPMSNLF